MRQVEAGRLDQLALGADPFEEHDQLQLEEDDRVDRGTTPLGVAIHNPAAHEAQIELRLQMPVEVAWGNEVLQRDGNRLVKTAGLGRAEHGALSDAGRLGNGPQSTARLAVARRFLQQTGAFWEPVSKLVAC